MRATLMGVAAAMAAAMVATVATSTALGQEPVRDSIPSDVRVGIVYQPAFRPGLAAPVFAATEDLRTLADSVRTIIRRDLDYSDRIEVMTGGSDVPISTPINYALWDELGAVWLLVGSVEGTPDAPILRLSLHDVVFRVLQDVRSYDLPPARHPSFRLGVHRAADDVMRWAAGTPGMAATRIAYVAAAPGGGSEIRVVDSDGFGGRNLTGGGSIKLSPAWSPKSDRVAYMSYENDEPALYELDVGTGRIEQVVDMPGLDMTPAYSPDGTELAFAATVEGRTEVHLYDMVKRCCARRITHARFANSLSPTYSPDGRRIAFNSDRLGQLHMFVMSVDDMSPELVTPYLYDQAVHYAGPDWSPTGDRIAFHGRSGQELQVFTIAPDGTGLRQLTQRGRNEDPSWAPDGRHIVFASTREGRRGLWILDVVSGRIRSLVQGQGARLPDWSGPIDSETRLTDGSSAEANGHNP